METRIQKWGNSLAVRIPKAFAEAAGLENETTVEINLIDGQIVISPATPRPLNLEDLLAQITDENLHGETDTGDNVGSEVW
jgi:antitoxin MazE